MTDIALPSRWSSLRGVHGGYLASQAVVAVEPFLAGRTIRTLATSFLRPSAVGEADIDVRILREGRTLATYDVTLFQAERPVVVTRLTASLPVVGLAWDDDPGTDVPPLDQCIEVTPPADIRHFDHARVRFDPQRRPFTRERPAAIAGWMQPVEPVAIDAAWLAMALDWFPPSPSSRVAPPIGGVSVDYTVHLHHVPGVPLRPDEWLAGSFRADVSSGGLAVERGRLHDQQGRLLAESFHTRWTG
jgi:acyl-CoA thioesterase